MNRAAQSTFQSREGKFLAVALLPVACAAIVSLTALGLLIGYGSASGIGILTTKVESLAAEADLTEDEEAVIPKEVPLFDDWPEEKPELVLVISGETLGYMRPCGCSEGQTGGMARRAGLMEFLEKEKGWQALALDFGDLVKAEAPWDRVRYPYIVESLKKLGYEAVGIGTHDLSMEASIVSGEALNSEPLKMLAGNIQSEQSDFDIVVGEFILPAKIIERGGKKIGVGSVIGDSQQAKIGDQSIKILSAEEASQKILDKFKSEAVDLKILFAHMPKAEAAALAERMSGFDLMLCQSELEHPQFEDFQTVGSTLVAFAGQKGLDVACFGYWPDGDPKLRFEAISISDRFKESEEINDIYARYVQRVWDDEYLAKLPRLPHPSGSQYVGSQQCAFCHPNTYEIWKKSKHAHALVTLEDAKPEGQHYNPECVKCHVVGFEQLSGFTTPDQSIHLGGVGCENCHGPASAHIADPNNEAHRAALRISKNADDCIKCHDSENSIHFKFDTYWPKIAHPGKK